MTPLVLDFDASVLALPEERRIELGNWQESIRFGCRVSTLHQLGPFLAADLHDTLNPVFMGSGDFHHVSYLLIERLRRFATPVRVVVFDNHPDNMRYPFGIHCGSWVWHASRLPHVARVEVWGIHSTDVERGHVWENHLWPLRRGSVRYHCIGRDLRWLKKFGGEHVRNHASANELATTFADTFDASDLPIYLSIDKDVLALEDARTNWDQGVMRWATLAAMIDRVRDRLIGCDVVGEVSNYRYRSLFKRVLSGLDQQPAIATDTLADWHAQHQTLNLDLLRRLAR